MKQRLRAFMETLFCLPFFVLSLALALAVGVPLAILLYPFLRLSQWSHAKTVARLEAEGVESNCSSEEFSEYADVGSWMVRNVMILPFLPLIFAGERLEMAALDAFMIRRIL